MSSISQFMNEVGKHSVLSRTDEIAKFTQLQSMNDELISALNRTAIFYHKVPSILVLLADGYEAVKNVIQPHKHNLNTKQLTAHVIETLHTYNVLYVDKVVKKIPETKIQLDKLTCDLAFDTNYVIELANEVRMYQGKDCLIDLHITEQQLDEIQGFIANRLVRIKRIRDSIVAANLRLVVSNARRYYRDGAHAQLEDLIQEGNIGLMTAVERYDVTTGNKFSTVATWWVRQSIIRSLQNGSRTIRVPVNVQDHIGKANSMVAVLEHKLKRKPSDREVADALGVTLERYKEIQDSNSFITSLDSPASNEEDSNLTLADVIADVARAADLDIYAEQVQGFVQQALERLPEREADVIRMRYGFDDEPMTLGECAVVLGCTKPSILNYENRALLKLHRFLCEML